MSRFTSRGVCYEGTTFIMMEYMEKGDFTQYLHKLKTLSTTDSEPQGQKRPAPWFIVAFPPSGRIFLHCQKVGEISGYGLAHLPCLPKVYKTVLECQNTSPIISDTLCPHKNYWYPLASQGGPQNEGPMGSKMLKILGPQGPKILKLWGPVLT